MIDKEAWLDVKHNYCGGPGDGLQGELIPRTTREVTDYREKYALANQDTDRAGQVEATRHYQNNRSKAKVPEPSRAPKPPVKVAPGQATFSRENSAAVIKGERLERLENMAHTLAHQPGIEMYMELADEHVKYIMPALEAAATGGAVAEFGMAVRAWRATNTVVIGTDAVTVANASRMVTERGVTQVLVHGHPATFVVNNVVTSPKSIARTILNSGFKRGNPVRLISCSTGALEDGAAYQLSRYLKSPVLAPTNKVRVLPGGGYDIYGGGIWVPF